MDGITLKISGTFKTESIKYPFQCRRICRTCPQTVFLSYFMPGNRKKQGVILRKNRLRRTFVFGKKAERSHSFRIPLRRRCTLRGCGICINRQNWKSYFIRIDFFVSLRYYIRRNVWDTSPTGNIGRNIQ